jgi:lysozyme family protein
MRYIDFVKALQTHLNELGVKPALKVDGDPGPKTQAALNAFNIRFDVTLLEVEDQDPEEGTLPWYRREFKRCEIDPGLEKQVAKAVALVEAGRSRYLDVANRLGAKDPQNFSLILGAIHFKEASCSFKGVLHNGEKIIGTGRQTSLVPKGRGPFNTWEDAAVDAIAMNPSRWSKLLGASDDVGDILWALERYNGTGYISGAGKAETSPYLWACSNINDGKGKYVSDDKFDPEASTQLSCGAALILKELWKAGKFKVTA